MASGIDYESIVKDVITEYREALEEEMRPIQPDEKWETEVLDKWETTSQETLVAGLPSAFEEFEKTHKSPPSRRRVVRTIKHHLRKWFREKVGLPPEEKGEKAPAKAPEPEKSGPSVPSARFPPGHQPPPGISDVI